MSLNGLDAPAVLEAYQAAIVEAGGWFLLKYTSRDAVELLRRGKSGVHEARTAISQYSDQSPLYGLIIYRRRRVLIKYIPEGTSRLLQARTAVHFQDVLERYSPYETLLEITTADGLNDTSLAASFPLHTASPSASSNRLHEISEDGEDLGPQPRRPTNQSKASGSIFGTQRYKMEKRVDQLMGPDRERRPTPSIQVTSNSPATPASPLSSPHKTLSSQFLVRDDSGQRSITSIDTKQSFASMTDYADTEATKDSTDAVAGAEVPSNVPDVPPQQPSELPPPSSRPATVERPATAERIYRESSERSVERPNLQERPSMSESERKYNDDLGIDWSKFDAKPKVKLGPRPVATGDRRQRPTVASVSAVPPAYRPAQKKSEPSRPHPQTPLNAAVVLPPFHPAPPPIPDMPEYTPRPLSRGSVKSLPSHKSTVMTPDKVRLMKAVELRKRQLRKSNPQPSTFIRPKDEDMKAMPNATEALTALVLKPAQQHSAHEAERGLSIEDEQRTASKKADSGISMNYDNHSKHEGGRTNEERQSTQSPEPPAHAETQAILERRVSVERTPSVVNEPTVSLEMLGDEPRSSMNTTLSIPTFARSTDQDSSLVPAILMNDESAASENPDRSQEVEKSAVNAVSEDSSHEASNVLEEPPPLSPSRNHGDLAKRRRGVVEPLHIDTEAELTSDDDFFEELRSAPLQHATHVTVARSPVMSSFTRRPSAQSLLSERSVPSVKSINIRKSSGTLLDTPTMETPEPALPEQTLPDVDGLAPTRSHSLSSPVSENADPVHGLKRHVSTGITKRIQALAEVSSRESSTGATQRETSPELSPAQPTWRDRKSSVRSPPRSRTSSYRRQSGRLNDYSPPSVQANSGFQRPEPIWNVQRESGFNRNSVSVSARIVRPKPAVESPSPSQAENQLQPSHLVVNQKRASALPPLDTNLYPSESQTPTAQTLTESAATAAYSTGEHRTLNSSQPKAFARHKYNLSQTLSPLTPSADDFPEPPLQSTNSQRGSFMDLGDPPKEGSRTSRFFKRMSGLGGAGRRKSAVQSIARSPSTADVATLAPGAGSTHTADTKSDMPPAVLVGDLNIQFPDTLLWKRRMVEIDDAGTLVFSTPQALDIQKGVAKRYHLTEFRMPYAPDLDRQELPCSIMLDFVDGTTLQAACEDSMTRGQVLHVLRTHWKAWAGA